MAYAARRFAKRLKGRTPGLSTGRTSWRAGLEGGQAAALAGLLAVAAGCVQQPSAPVESPPETRIPTPPTHVSDEGPPEPPIQQDLAPAEAEPAGFLAELRGSFQLDHHVEQPSVARQITALATQKAIGDRLGLLNERDRDGEAKSPGPRRSGSETGVGRLDTMRHACAEVRARGLPGELCLVPIVESGLNPYAFSPQGAGGLWQFVPGTARQYGLKVDWWADERRDPVAATTAALDYLTQLHARFGDWLLAMAAYNCGEGRLARSLRSARVESPQRGSARGRPLALKTPGFFDIEVPRETREHVAKVLAYAAVLATPGQYGVELPFGDGTSAEVGFAIVETGSQIDIALAAAAMGKPPEYLYRRNPALKRWATHPRGPHRLIVDASDAQAAIDAIEGLRSDERLQWQRVRIEANDTLGHLALRFGTDVATLRQMNGLPSTLIRTGDELLVPIGGVMRRPGSGIFGPQRSAADARAAFVYVVRSGDSIWRIARRLGVTRKALMQANGIGPGDILRIGQRLVVDAP